MKNNRIKLNSIIFIFLMNFFLTSLLSAKIMPVIMIKKTNTKRSVPLKMHELQVNVKVVGNIAVTTMEMTFYNNLNRVLEGRFYFPLGEGQTVSRFALDIRGKLREGVVVEKAKGRKVFESVVRSMIDPGLLEWTKGNSFKARIYPIPAKGYKKLVIAYEQEIKDIGKGFLYLLPLAFKDKVDIFKLSVNVFKQYAKPILGKENELVNFRFKRWNEAYIANVKKLNYRPNKQLAFLLPKTTAYKKIIIENDNKTENRFFYIHVTPKLYRSTKKLPRKICLIWDASASAEKKNVKKEFAVLNKYFKKIKNCNVRLVLVRNDIENINKNYRIKNGNWNALKKSLKKVKYDGGTSLGAINLKKYKCDEFILSTDGISNFGKDEIILSGTPVIVLNSKLTAQHSYLKYIAQKTGGVYLNLTRLTKKEALRSLLNQPYSFIKASYNNVEINDTYPSIPTVIEKGFSISGKMTKNKAKIILHFGHGNTVKHSITVHLNKKKHLSDSGLIKRIWAQKKIAQLDMMYKKHEHEIISLGKSYNIVTRNTSLIVLDRISDYVKHRIVPPKELQNQYYSMINSIRKRKQKEIFDHIELVVKKFKAVQKWWNTKFSMGNPPKIEHPKKSMRNGRARDRMRESSENRLQPRRRVPRTANGSRHDKKKKGESTATESGIVLKKWTPDTPYLRILKKENHDEIYSTYIKIKKEYANSSAFYLDVADLFIKRKLKKLALRILSNIAEMELENPQLLRILGHRLAQLGYYRLSIFVFNEVLKMRGEDPQSYRDLGLVYSYNKQHQKAINHLYKVVSKKWDSRFRDIELIVLNEMNAIIALNKGLDLSHIDKRLIKSMPVDIRVVLNWDADNTDMDLWVTDPNKEKCYYGHKRTYVGGRMSQDFTQGYGPEEFMLRRAKKGTYNIQVNYYGNRQQIIAGATTVQVILYLDFGKINQRKKEITLRLKNKKEIVNVGKFKIAFRRYR